VIAVKKLETSNVLDTHDWDGATSNSGPGDLQDSSADQNVLGAQKPVRLLLVDSMPVVLRGLEAALQSIPNVELVGAAGDHERVVALTKQLQPNVVLIDILGRNRGSRSMRVQLDVLRKIRRASPNTRCIVFTNFHPKHMVKTVLEEGAAGVWSKFDDITLLANALHEIVDNADKKSLSPSIQHVISVQSSSTDREANWLTQLTQRERQILKLVLDGEDSYQIGERLGISPRTVSTHRSRILQKTNARSFFELIGCLRQLEELGN
jgi:DNA-binding NarL/FixJ family response regulator